MPVKSLLKKAMVLVLLPLPGWVAADTNVAGDEIIILGDHPAIVGLEASLSSAGSGLLPDPILNYLPAIKFDETGHILDENVAGNLWQRIKDGYGMPELDSEYTAKHESWYASRPDYVYRMVLRSQKY